MSTITASLEDLDTFEFTTGEPLTISIVIGKTCRYVVDKCRQFVSHFNGGSDYYVINGYTSDGYKIDTLNQIMSALEAEPISVPSNKKEYFAWLKGN